MQVQQDFQVNTAPAEHPDSHYQPLIDALPSWLGQISPAQRQALKASQPQLADALQSATPEQHQRLKSLTTAHWTAQSAVDERLAHLQDASRFAEPLLKEALKNRFGLDLDVRSTFLRLYIPVTVPGFAIQTGARAWTVSLLDAALHNFEERESADDAYESASTFITAPSPTGQFDTLPLIQASMSIAAFIRLCREIDIGTRYEACLRESLGLSEPVGAAVLRLKINASQQAALKAALQWARMNGDLSEVYARLIGGLADGLQGMRINGQALRCHDLTMMSARLTGILVFATDLQASTRVGSVVAYIPDDPLHPIKEYASTTEMAGELTRQLRARDYQQFFSRFIDHERLGPFFATLNSRLTQVTWHEPVKGSALPAWREEPTEPPNLQLVATAFSGEMWQHLYQRKLDKILSDARTLAVPTAYVDQNARWARWNAFVSLASSIVQAAAFIVAPFVPVLGELMMGYMAYQLLDDAFEGIVDWAEGQTGIAFDHLMSVMESLVQLGVFAAGSKLVAGLYRQVLPQEVVAFIDRFLPVERANGSTRYWKPDLRAYQHPAIPAADAPINELGLRQHQGKQLLAIEDAHYAVSQNPVSGRYQIDHPTRVDAYKPLLRHNGEGAWHTELEQPLEWDGDTALRRLGHHVEPFSTIQRQRILKVSGYSEDGLRKMHVNQQTLPPLLADSIRRFRIDLDLGQLLDQLASDLPDQYTRADPLTQLQLLGEQHRWPANKRLQLIDAGGQTAWTSSADERLPVTQIRLDKLIERDLLKTLLHSLDESEIKHLLNEEFGQPTLALDVRTRTLRKQVLRLARKYRAALFESRYKALEHTDDVLARQVAQHNRQLPASVTRELLDTATPDERQQIRQGQLPPRQQSLIAVANQHVRITRAFEGLELASVSNPDTDLLALQSLQRLPGWSGQVRIEMRDRSYDGPLLTSIAAPQASSLKVLVRQADGRYQPWDDRGQPLHSLTDFYTSVLYALPDSERQALGIHIGQGEPLKTLVREHPLERSELIVKLYETPIHEPTVDTLRLTGSDGYRRILRTVNTSAEQPLTLEQRVQALYPQHSAQQIQATLADLQNHPAGARAELSRLRNEYARLTHELSRWDNALPTVDHNGTALTAPELHEARLARRFLRHSLEKSWRREADSTVGHMLFIPGSIRGDLPSISGDFSHVAWLQINGRNGTTHLNGFLQNFRGLLHLELQDFSMPGLPESITSMRALRQLVVRNCGITLSIADQRVLASLPNVSILDLQDNPLARPPDVHALAQLRELNLANTGITLPPADLLNHPRLIAVNLYGNRITELPPPLLTLGAELSNGFNFANNPLSAAAREQIKIHYNRTGKDFGVLAEQVDTDRVRALFPEQNVRQATDLLYRLPGTLAEGREQLSRWEGEIVRLLADLAQWENDIPDRSPVTGQQLNINETFTEHTARTAFARQLEQFWRTRHSDHPDHFSAALTFCGDLPVLSADFSHVSILKLTGNVHVSAVDSLLQRFGGLQTLQLNDFNLGQVPSAVSRMSQLHTLTLNRCAVVLTPEGQSRLASLAQLKILELANNPLGTPLDLTSLPHLYFLDLSGSALSTLPTGLADHPQLKTLIFSDNQISELPDPVLKLSAQRIDGFDFADNPWSAATRERIKSRFREIGRDFGVHAETADIVLAQELFPALDNQDASDVIYNLPGTLIDGRKQLRHWRVELTQLIADLKAWSLQAPERHPLTQQPLSAEQHLANHVARTEFGQILERYWRDRPDPELKRENHFTLRTTFLGDMPRLTADFSHVSLLSLQGNPAVGAVDPFLEPFTNLHVLNLRDFALDQVPSALTRMPVLRELSLTHCRLAMTPDGQTVLSSLGSLESLDLSDNPLTIAPSLEGMPLLNELRLPNTGIEHLPKGMTELHNLSLAMLHGNRISDLPPDLFAMEADSAEGINLANNPLSAASRERIKAGYAESGNDFAVRAEEADIQRTRALFPELDEEDASHVLYTLPGTLDEGRAQLARWEQELGRMSQELDLWIADIPAQHPMTGQSLNADELAAERTDRTEFAQKLEYFWRHRLPQTAALRDNSFIAKPTFLGDLPALTTDFSHVSALSLSGHPAAGIHPRFLECFTGLQHLELRNFNLGTMPKAVSGMPSLNYLVMSRCSVVFDSDGQAVLSSLTRLKMLDLFDNPLGTTPDVTPLRSLTFIDLSNTAIEHMPTGLLDLPQLSTVLLRDNHITELPEAIFELPGASGDGFDLSNNPLTAATLERVKAYRQKSGSDFGAWAAPADIDQAIALYPDLTSEEASHLFLDLPGTLADGRAELTRRQIEFDTLTRDLAAWVGEVANDTEEQGHRAAFKTALEQCWRRVPLENRSLEEYHFKFDGPMRGDLPVLTARFDYVLDLSLTRSAPQAASVGNFLEHFPNLTHLKVRGYRLTTFPEAVLRMQALTSLDLSGTGLGELPIALVDNRRLIHVDLSNNAIREVPTELTQADATTTVAFNLSANPLSPPSLARIAEHFRRTGNTLGVSPGTAL